MAGVVRRRPVRGTAPAGAGASAAVQTTRAAEDPGLRRPGRRRRAHLPTAVVGRGEEGLGAASGRRIPRRRWYREPAVATVPRVGPGGDQPAGAQQELLRPWSSAGPDPR